MTIEEIRVLLKKIDQIIDSETRRFLADKNKVKLTIEDFDK
ncbi:MAG: hypothetical protein ACXAAM_00770 [Candidatus Heimdallarchaeaceae archaeon]|jgi:hypothetical protein